MFFRSIPGFTSLVPFLTLNFAGYHGLSTLLNLNVLNNHDLAASGSNSVKQLHPVLKGFHHSGGRIGEPQFFEIIFGAIGKG